MLDQAGVVRAIGQAAAFVQDLAPGQRVPFAIIVPGGLLDGQQSAVYLDATVAEAISTTITATVTKAYLDECGCFRLVALVSNNGGQALTVRLVAAVYDAQAGLLQVQAFSSTLPIGPGAQLPVDVSLAASVNSQISAERSTLEVDLVAQAPASGDAVPLPAGMLSTSPSQWELNFEGQITNTSRQTLTGIDVVAAAYEQPADRKPPSLWALQRSMAAT